MGSTLRRALIGTLVALGVSLIGSNVASAAFPNFSDCPRTGANTCINIVSRTGSNQVIKGFRVPLNEGTLEIRGALRFAETGAVFVPPTGTNGFFARSVAVPGGLLGIDLPLPFNDVYATPQLAGSASSISINPGDLGLRLPIKLRLTNPLLGSNCYIGSNSNPVRLFLQTTHLGTITETPTYMVIAGNVNEDRTYSVPGANGCLLGLGLVNGLINLKLGLPSSSGNNSMTIVSDVGLQAAF